MLEPKQSLPTNTTTDDWTLLREAVKEFKRTVTPFWSINAEAGAILQDLVPKLLDAYADLWELSSQMTLAWESLNQSKENLYVPDAQDMVDLKRDGEL